jgi:hypothetical protein
MATARAAAAAAGPGPVMGWALAILGDLGYFLVLMASTLWLSSVVGDERLTIGVVLGAMWILPMVIRKWRERNASPSARTRAAPLAHAEPEPVSVVPRKKTTRAARKRARLAAGSR